MEKKIILVLNYDDDRSSNALDSLRALGFIISTVPVSGIPPELINGDDKYKGIDAIEKFIEQEREKKEKSR